MSGIYRQRGETDAEMCKQKRGFHSIVKSNLKGLREREAAGQQKWSGGKDNNGNEENMGSAVTKNSE